MPTAKCIPRKIFEKNGLDRGRSAEAAGASLVGPPMEASASIPNQLIYNADTNHSHQDEYEASDTAVTVKPDDGCISQREIERDPLPASLDRLRGRVVAIDRSSEINDGHSFGPRKNASVHQMEMELIKKYVTTDAKSSAKNIDSSMSADVSHQNDSIENDCPKTRDQITAMSSKRK